MWQSFGHAAPAVLGVGCTAPGSTTLSMTASPESGQGRSLFVNEFGVIHYSDGGPANGTSPKRFLVGRNRKFLKGFGLGMLVIGTGHGPSTVKIFWQVW